MLTGKTGCQVSLTTVNGGGKSTRLDAVDLQSWSRKGFGGNDWDPMERFGVERKIVCGGECSCVTHVFVLSDRTDRPAELRICASWKSTILSKQRKKEERLHSKRSRVKIMMAKILRQIAAKSMYVVSLHCWRCGNFEVRENNSPRSFHRYPSVDFLALTIGPALHLRSARSEKWRLPMHDQYTLGIR